MNFLGGGTIKFIQCRLLRVKKLDDARVCGTDAWNMRELMMSLIYTWISTIITIFQSKVLTVVSLMKATLKYLAGSEGPSGYGSNTTAQQVAQDCFCSNIIPNLQLTAIITGATSGIGAETARVMAKNGVRVVIPARDLRKAEELKERIQRESPEAEIIALEMDLSSFASIQRFCSDFLSLGLPLHILINNAGKYSHKLEFSEDKIELTFATNYLGHFLLTEMLMEKMVETAAESGREGRIVNVTSVIHSWVKRKNFCFSKLLNPKSYNGTYAYAHSKLANILHAKELSSQLKGAATTCYVALSSQIAGISGDYFADCNLSHCSALANEEAEARKLWKQTRAFIQRRLLQPKC
ncbi:short-chain dehydrogenase TIC 32, chloroplastic-like isoform X2 [Sesamum indicum]|uniref:Short-chain dehydrogenase TIC 32, chloroplastic-like isoform X2 n=1 Tax=Sesamum indicum TaxID=4182 RepID=A0A8M8UL84_SESIN|nr:short-chain dehydrogenase TIC 32, chloroplastic-like isoform X2 [Sesamum indicum]